MRTGFYDLMKESVIVQGLIALVCIIGTFLLLLTEHPVPDYVWILDASVVSFFFGAKSLMSQRQAQIETALIMSRVANEVVRQNVGGPLGAAAEQNLRQGWQHDDSSAARAAGKFEKPL